MRPVTIGVIALLGFAIIFTAACSSSSSHSSKATPTYTVEPTHTAASTLTPGFANYTNTSLGFSISVPDGWFNSTAESDGRYWNHFGPSGSAYVCEGNAVAFGVTATDTSYTSVQTYYSEVVEPNIENLNEYTIISKENLTIDGIPAIKVIHTWIPYEVTVQETECFLVKQQTLWWIRGTCAQACWETYADTFDTMIDSFRFIN